MCLVAYVLLWKLNWFDQEAWLLIENFCEPLFFSHGLVGHRTSDNIQDFRNPVVVGYYSVDYVKNQKGTNYWRNRILKVSCKSVTLENVIPKSHLLLIRQVIGIVIYTELGKRIKKY